MTLTKLRPYSFDACRESPEDDDATLAAMDTSELTPLPEEEDLPATAGGPAAAGTRGNELGMDAELWGAVVEGAGVYAYSEGENESGGQMREALKGVVLGEGCETVKSEEGDLNSGDDSWDVPS